MNPKTISTFFEKVLAFIQGKWKDAGMNKTIHASELQRIKMVSGQETKTPIVVDGNRVIEWVGFGWIQLTGKSAAEAIAAAVPCIVRGVHPLKPENAARFDTLAREHTAFRTFQALIDAKGYFPSLRSESARACLLACGRKIGGKDHRQELTELADGYDWAQAERSDARRARRS